MRSKLELQKFLTVLKWKLALRIVGGGGGGGGGGSRLYEQVRAA
jgi:hypothetical protein